MKEENLQIQPGFKREKHVNGFLFGLTAGLMLVIGLWGMDAAILSWAHAGWAWLKLLIGAPFLLLICGLAGWLTAQFDNSFLGGIIWLAASLAVVWIASHVPFQGLSLVVGYLEPDFAGLGVYPFVESARARMGLLSIVAGLFMAIGGGFEMFFVEAATRASSRFSRIFNLFTCLVIFIPTGLVMDNLINQSLREPFSGLNEVIQYGLKAEGTPVSVQEKRAMSLSSIYPFGDLIHSSYHLYLGTYSPEDLSETSIHIDFGGEWGTCYLLGDHPIFCQLSRDRYLQKFACLVAGDNLQKCKLRSSPESLEKARQLFAQLSGEPSKYGILGQYGSAVALVYETSLGEQVQCVFKETGEVQLDTCRQTSGKFFAPVQLATMAVIRTSTPTADPVQVTLPVQPAEFAPQAALVDPSLLSLPALKGAPRYAINLTVSADLRSFQGSERVEFVNNEGLALDALYFRLFPNGNGSYGNGSLSVQRLSIAGQLVQVELSVNDTVLKAPLASKLEPGQGVDLEFEFSGVVPQDFGSDAAPTGYGIYNYSDSVLALSGWYPILAVYDEQGWNLDAPSLIGDSVYSDIAFYSVDVSLPSHMVLAATGVQMEHEELDGVARYRLESGPARDFFLIASPNFQIVSQSVGETTVNSYYLPGREAAGQVALGVTADSLGIYNQKFGFYPYREFDVVAGPMRNALGVEYPGIVMVAASLYNSPEKPDFEVTVAHEVAHQWWYNVVGNDVFDEPWLDEALVTYCSSLYYEFVKGEGYLQGLQGYWQERYERVLSESGDDAVAGSLKHFESLDKPSVYGGIVYVKGALFFKALRQEVGDQAFFQALQDYYQSRYFQIGHAVDLLEAFEKATGRDLDAFYSKWLYSKE